MLGATLPADDNVVDTLGGKGANQAIGCARLAKYDGCSYEVQMMGQLGDDKAGVDYLKYLAENHVQLDNIRTLEGKQSGLALIFIKKTTGENTIVIVGGANTAYPDEGQILTDGWVESIKKADVLLLQKEIPQRVNIAAAKVAKEHGVKVIMDVGGNDELMSKEFLANIDYISPNETELQLLVESTLGMKDMVEKNVEVYIKEILTEFTQLKILYKIGEHGSALYSINPETSEISNIRVPALNFADFKAKHPDFALVDTTGAGDAFTAGFAVGLIEGKSEQDAMMLGTQTAFLTISRIGAGPAIPDRAEIESFFRE